MREYALLADGERGALVGPRGDVVWLCVPRWDSDAVFSTLVGGAGRFAVTPVGRFVWGGYYEDRSLIWRSRWVTGNGIVECHEALAFPGDIRRVVLRRIVAVSGDARVTVEVAPAAGFGRHGLQNVRRTDAGWEGRTGGVRLRLSGTAAADVAPDARGGCLAATVAVPEGGHRDLVPELLDTGLDGAAPDADRAWAATRTAWRAPVPPVAESLAPRDARHSYAVLRGLTSSRATRSWRRGGSSATGPRAGRRACSSRSTTWASGNCAATCPRRSCTR